LILRPAAVAAGPAFIGLGVAWAQGNPLGMGLSIGAGIGLALHWFVVPFAKACAEP